ncbi:MAG TPA: hypothetical protein VMB73_09690 [Acetobacteraceae bacterium]|nr:hypothetical protein [Acetobacteraceae bacterium]
MAAPDTGGPTSTVSLVIGLQVRRNTAAWTLDMRASSLTASYHGHEGASATSLLSSCHDVAPNVYQNRADGKALSSQATARRATMRIGYAMAVAAFLAAAPAMAQVSITTGNDAAQRHQYNSDQDRAAGRANMQASHQEAAEGNYGNAARDRQAAHEDWHAAHHQDHDADRDAHSGVTVRLGQ